MKSFAPVLLSALALASRAPAEDAPKLECPEGTQRAPDREARVRGMLATTREGAELLASPAGAVTACFGDVPESGLLPGGLALLDARTSDARAAAFLAHLIAHRAEWATFEGPARGEACEAWVDRVMLAERRARATEARIAASLGAGEPAAISDDEARSAYATRCRAPEGRP